MFSVSHVVQELESFEQLIEASFDAECGDRRPHAEGNRSGGPAEQGGLSAKAPDEPGVEPHWSRRGLLPAVGADLLRDEPAIMGPEVMSCSIQQAETQLRLKLRRQQIGEFFRCTWLAVQVRVPKDDVNQQVCLCQLQQAAVLENEAASAELFRPLRE